ncbi:MAG: glutathione peroxidase [Motiliproteus sp.]|nr:glutathione peroxidase [Motiliproteus sp.]
MQNTHENKPVPQTNFRFREGDQWVDRSTADLFNDKTVVLFALPGAFTPTCSSSHLPRYNELAGKFQQNGVDAIYCLSVNDAFVMNAWKEDQGTDNIIFLADGNGDFSEGMGQLVSKSDLGFGKRSWRYSMLVKNGVVEKMFVEPDLPGDPFQVSDADTMLTYLNPEETEEKTVTLFARPGCGHCVRAKQLLDAKGLTYEEIQLGRDVNHRGLKAVTGRQTVPQIYIDGQHIGGADELEAHFG